MSIDDAVVAAVIFVDRAVIFEDPDKQTKFEAFKLNKLNE